MRLYRLTIQDEGGCYLSWHSSRRAAKAYWSEFRKELIESCRRRAAEAEAIGDYSEQKNALSDIGSAWHVIDPVEFECSKKGVLELLRRYTPDTDNG